MSTQSTIYARGQDGANHNAPAVFGQAGQFLHGYEGVGGVNKTVLQPQTTGGGGLSANASPNENDVQTYHGNGQAAYATSCHANGGTAPYTATWSSSSGESGTGFTGQMHINVTGPNTYQCTCTFTVRDAAGATTTATALVILSEN